MAVEYVACACLAVMALAFVAAVWSTRNAGVYLPAREGRTEFDFAELESSASFYREIVERIGAGFGNPAYINDEGQVGDSVHCLKVPELVMNLRAHADRLQEENDYLEGENYRLAKQIKRPSFTARRCRMRRKNPTYRRRSSASSALLAGAVGLVAGYFLGDKNK